MKSENFYIKNHFELGSILYRTFKILTLHPLIFLGLGAILALPFIVLLSVRPGISWQYVILYWVLSCICQGIVSAVVYQALQGEKVNIGESVVMGLKRTPTLLMVAFCCALCVSCGFFLFVLPAPFIFAAISMATPACVIEKLGPIKSIGRSEELTKGNCMRIIGLYLVLGLVCFFLNFLLYKLIILIKPPFFSIAEILPFAKALAHMVWLITSSIIVTIIYNDLRAIREGNSVGALTDVFD